MLGDRVTGVKTTSRLYDSPAIVTDHESASLRRMMQMVDAAGGGGAGGKGGPKFKGQQALEVNPAHAVIRGLAAARVADPALAAVVAEQVFDNALVAAGLLDDPRTMLPRLNSLLARVLPLGDAAAAAKPKA